METISGNVPGPRIRRSSQMLSSGSTTLQDGVDSARSSLIDQELIQALAIELYGGKENQAPGLNNRKTVLEPEKDLERVTKDESMDQQLQNTNTRSRANTQTYASFADLQRDAALLRRLQTLEAAPEHASDFTRNPFEGNPMLISSRAQLQALRGYVEKTYPYFITPQEPDRRRRWKYQVNHDWPAAARALAKRVSRVDQNFRLGWIVDTHGQAYAKRVADALPAKQPVTVPGGAAVRESLRRVKSLSDQMRMVFGIAVQLANRESGKELGEHLAGGY